VGLHLKLLLTRRLVQDFHEIIYSRSAACLLASTPAALITFSKDKISFRSAAQIYLGTARSKTSDPDILGTDNADSQFLSRQIFNHHCAVAQFKSAKYSSRKPEHM
jgi:hypothetical protein